MPSLADLATNYGLAVGAPIVGGILNRSAAGTATNALTTGGNAAIDTINQGNAGIQDLLKQIYGTNKDALAPYAAAGPAAVKSLSDATAPGGALVKPFTSADVNLASDPGMQYRIDNGMKLLNRTQASSGSLSSGAAWSAKEKKIQDLSSQEFQNAFNRDFATDQANKDQLRQALTAQIGVGQNATNTEVNAGNTYATQSVEAEKAKTQAIADLQTQIASAQAQGDVAKANALTQTLNGTATGVQNVKDMKTLATILSPAAKVAAPALASVGTSLGATTLAGAANAGAVGAGSIGAATGLAPVAPAITGAAPAAASTATAAGATGAGGFGSAVAGFMTNPVTIGVGVALAAGYAILRHTQEHQTADQWTKNVQTPFGQHLVGAVQALNQALASGKLTKDQATQAVAQIKDMTDQYQQASQQFRAKGKKQNDVINQSDAEMSRDFGPGFSKLSSDLNAQVQNVAA